MRKRMSKGLLTLGLVGSCSLGSAALLAGSAGYVVAGSGLAAASTPTCEYPMNQGLQTNDSTVPSTSSPGTCTNESQSSSQTISQPTATDPTPGTPTNASVQNAAPAPIVQASTTLAFTGADVVETVGIGIALIGGGGAIVYFGRRRRSAH